MRIASVLSCLSLLLLAAGCGSGGNEDPAAASVGVQVDPRAADTVQGGTVAFQATVTGTAATGVTWSVDCGSITQAGLYTAPQSGAVCHVTATSVAAPVAGQAIVNVGTTASGDWSATCAARPMRSTGTTYYVCDCVSDSYGNPDAGCVAGNDSNNGTSPSTPFRTYGRASQAFTGMNGGDTVAFCKGGRFSASGGNSWGKWANPRCSASNTCDVRDYAPSWGGTSKPKIVLTGGGFAMPIGQTFSPVTAGYRIFNLAFIENTPNNNPGEAMPISSWVSDLEVCNTTFDGWNIIVESNQGDCSPTAAGGGYRRHFRGNQFLNSCQHGILFEGHDSDFDGNLFDNNGNDDCTSSPDSRLLSQTGGTNHTFYLQAWCGAHNVRFINNRVLRQGMANYSGTLSPTAQAVNLNGGDVTNFVIENNLIDMRPSHSATVAGTAIKAVHTYGPSAPWTGLVIRRNRILGGSGGQIQVANAPNALIEDNTVAMDGGSLQWEPILNIPWSSDGVTTATIRNNTFYLANVSGVQAIGSMGSGAAGGFNVTGNTVTFVGGSNTTCYRVDDPSRLAFMDNNHCYGATNWIESGGSKSLSTWQSAQRRDLASITSAPSFVAAPDDLTPASGSPLLGAGSSAATCSVQGATNQSCSSPIAIGSPQWSPTDKGKTRSAPIDIGAFQR